MSGASDLHRVENRRAGAGADWLSNFDARCDEIVPVLRRVYGGDAALCLRRWRIFFLATAGMFGHAGGTEWGVSHYRMRAA